MIVKAREWKRETVDIVMPVLNNGHYTELAVSSLKEKTGYPYRLIVIDNGSDIGNRNKLKAMEKRGLIDVLIRNKKNMGFGHAVNQGAQEVRSSCFVIANNDIMVTKGWLWKLVKAMQADERTAVSSPLRLQKEPPGEGKMEICAYQYDNLPGFPVWQDPGDPRTAKDLDKVIATLDAYQETLDTYFAKSGMIPESYNHGMVPFFCVLVKKPVFDKLGGMDKDFGIGLCEDTYFCSLLQRDGLKMAVSRDCFVYHFMSRTLINVYGTWDAVKQQIADNNDVMRRKLERK